MGHEFSFNSKEECVNHVIVNVNNTGRLAHIPGTSHMYKLEVFSSKQKRSNGHGEENKGELLSSRAITCSHRVCENE